MQVGAENLRIGLQLHSFVGALPLQAKTFTAAGPIETAFQRSFAFWRLRPRLRFGVGFFRRLRFRLRFGQGGLDRKGDALGFAVHGKDLYVNFLTFAHNITDGAHSVVGQFRNVNESFDTRCQLDERPEFGDARYRSFDHGAFGELFFNVCPRVFLEFEFTLKTALM